MDSCTLAAVDEGGRRVGDPLSADSAKDGCEVEVTSLEEAKSVIAALRARQRAQAQQMLAWRRTLKLQVRGFSIADFILYICRPEEWGEAKSARDPSELLSPKTLVKYRLPLRGEARRGARTLHGQ